MNPYVETIGSWDVYTLDRISGSGAAPVCAEHGLGTPSLGVLATPVGVIHNRAFVHEWIVNAFSVRQVLFRE